MNGSLAWSYLSERWVHNYLIHFFYSISDFSLSIFIFLNNCFALSDWSFFLLQFTLLYVNFLHLQQISHCLFKMWQDIWYISLRFVCYINQDVKIATRCSLYNKATSIKYMFWRKSLLNAHKAIGEGKLIFCNFPST